MSMSENPRAVIGDNVQVDRGKQIAEALARDYAATAEAIDDVLAIARSAIDDGTGKLKPVATDEEALALGVIIKQLRDLDTRVEALRVAERDPYKQGVDAVNGFFFPLREKMARRQKGDKPGAADVLQGLVDSHMERKRIEEETRRRREAEEAARIAREAQEKAAAEARAAEEAQKAAARARNPEQIKAKAEAAGEALASATAAGLEASLATQAAEAARIDTLAKPADMVRTRGDGVMLTSAREAYAVVTDRSKLDFAALAPYFTDAEIEKALRGWAKAHNHSQQMLGAEIGHRAKGVTR